jgi:hypothetical protein
MKLKVIKTNNGQQAAEINQKFYPSQVNLYIEFLSKLGIECSVSVAEHELQSKEVCYKIPLVSQQN